MRLLRLVVENFRGIEGPRELTFAERGITLVEGPNEAGKSSIAEALRLVRDVKASSQAAEVRAVRPTHVQADPRVEIEVRSGAYHFTYAKTFSRKGATQLTVHAPAAESHTGDAAHDRATAIFAETIDADLWRALHLVQGHPLDQPVLATLEPLHIALAERDDGDGVDVHADLLARVETEYLQYFTPTGRPKGDYARLEADLETARRDVETTRGAVDGVARLVERHEQLRLRCDELEDTLTYQRKEVERLRGASEELDQLRDELREARQVLRGAEQAALAARRAQQRRDELVREEAEAEVALAHAEAARTAAREALTALGDDGTADPDPADAVDAAREALDLAAAALDNARTAEELRRVEERLTRARELAQRIAEATEIWQGHRVDATSLRELVEAEAAWSAAQRRNAVVAPLLRIERCGDDAAMLDGEELSEADTELTVLRPTVVELPGALRVTVTPQERLAEQAEDTEQLRQDFLRRCARLGVDDLDDARRQAQQRDGAQRAVDALAAELRALLGETTEAQLTAEVAALRSRLDAAPAEALDPAAAREEHQRARQAYDDAVLASRASRESRAKRAAIEQELRERLIEVTTEFTHTEARLARARELLATARLEASDEQIAEAAVAADAAVAAAADTSAALERDLQDRGADDLASDLATAEEVLRANEQQAQQLRLDLAGLDAQLELRGRDGLQDAANQAEERQEDLRRQWASLDARARAARRLHDTLTAHAQRARRRYVGPFREAIVGLGRAVFGEGFDVEIGEDLAIVSRTLDGRTVPFGSLSGGAREQLGVLGRVATARLVGDDAGVPVILDDALGYADRQRRHRVTATLQRVARESGTQIIVLTCDPGRFDAMVPDQRIQL